MVNHGNRQHQENIEESVKELNKKGYYAINLHGKSPDGIAYKDGKLYAIEVLGVQYLPKKMDCIDKLHLVKKKKRDYDMFDNVIFRIFLRGNKTMLKEEIVQKNKEKEAKNIVEEFLNSDYF